MDVNKKNINILLIGCTGFLGGRLIEKLYKENKYNLTVTSHSFSGNGLARAARFPIKIVSSSFLDINSIKTSMKDIDVVINGAYLRGKDAVKQSVIGTQNLLRISDEFNVKQFIQISSASVFEPDETPVKDETDSYIKKPDDYVKAKLETEKEVKNYFLKNSNSKMKYTIIRPTRIYGPYSAYWTERLIEGIQLRKKLLIDEFEDNPSNFVYVDDVCLAISKCILEKKAFNNDFNINGEKELSWKVLLDGLQNVIDSNQSIKTTTYKDLKYIEKNRVKKMIPNAINSLKKALLSNDSIEIFRNDLLLSSVYRSLYGRFRKSDKGLSYEPKKESVNIEDFSFLDKFFVKDMKAKTYISSTKINDILNFKNEFKFSAALIEIESWNKYFSRKNYVLSELYNK